VINGDDVEASLAQSFPVLVASFAVAYDIQIYAASEVVAVGLQEFCIRIQVDLKSLGVGSVCA